MLSTASAIALIVDSANHAGMCLTCTLCLSAQLDPSASQSLLTLCEGLRKLILSTDVGAVTPHVLTCQVSSVHAFLICGSNHVSTNIGDYMRTE